MKDGVTYIAPESDLGPAVAELLPGTVTEVSTVGGSGVGITRTFWIVRDGVGDLRTRHRAGVRRWDAHPHAASGAGPLRGLDTIVHSDPAVEPCRRPPPGCDPPRSVEHRRQDWRRRLSAAA